MEMFKVPGYVTISEASDKRLINKSKQWISVACRKGHIKGWKKFGNMILLPESECERIRKDPPILSRKDYGRE